MSTAQEAFPLKGTDPKVPQHSIPNLTPKESSIDSKPIDATRKKLTMFDKEDSIAPPQYTLNSTVLEPLHGRFQLLQLWEGQVVDVEKEEFVATISDKTNPDLPDELVTLDIEEIAPDDIPLAQRGSIFYWSIGYVDYPGRGRIRESKIRFRRLPSWTINEIEKAKEAGSRLAKFFDRD